MRWVLYVLGSILILLGLLGLLVEIGMRLDGETADPFLGATIVASCLLLGAFAVTAAKLRYKGGWPTAIGLILATFGLLGLAIELDAYVAANQEDPVTGVLLGVGSLVAGTLLLRSGHKAHASARTATTARGETHAKGVQLE
jgi:hypothetical protein